MTIEEIILCQQFLFLFNRKASRVRWCLDIMCRRSASALTTQQKNECKIWTLPKHGYIVNKFKISNHDGGKKNTEKIKMTNLMVPIHAYHGEELYSLQVFNHPYIQPPHHSTLITLPYPPTNFPFYFLFLPWINDE